MTALGDGLALLVGTAIGYLTASVLESFLHEWIGHAPVQTVEAWKEKSELFRYLARAHYSHNVVHHLRTFTQDHVTQFRSTEEHERLDRELAALGAEGERIKRSRYGLRLHGPGALVFAVPLLPALPLTTSAAGACATLGAAVALSMPPALSFLVHSYLHVPHRQALRQAPRVIAWLLQRWYFRKMAEHHYVHHCCPCTNFNLLLGGDWLRGRHRRASVAQRSAMRDLGLGGE